ncbi:MAG: FAD-dependent oxidoreductase [Armatimonadota bacterium]|nr:FAD-dependent oxidoreductase [Armatimonadota bacterium]
MAIETGLLVAGGGPAGLAAATEAAEAGVEVLVADEHRTAGGVLACLGQMPVATDAGPAPAADLRRALADAARAAGATILTETLVWAAFEDLSAGVLTPGENLEVRAQAIVVAAGAADRPLPFPGWETPNVLNAQEALRLVSFHDALRDRIAVVAGAGGAGVPVALALRAGGLTVAALAEAASLADDERAALAGAGIPAVEGARVAAAEGQEYLRAVILQRNGERRRIDADVLVLATGRMPLIELLGVAGCATEWRPDLGGYIPVRSARLETSVAGLFAAGACGAVCGPLTAVAEGRLAGAAAALRLGRGSGARVEALEQALVRARSQEAAQVAREMTVLAELEADAVAAALRDPDQIFCRCEKVPVAKVQAAIEWGARTAGEVKRLTRVGMGECQGRACRPLLSRAVAQILGEDIIRVQPITYRPPVRPIPLAALLRGTE